MQSNWGVLKCIRRDSHLLFRLILRRGRGEWLETLLISPCNAVARLNADSLLGYDRLLKLAFPRLEFDGMAMTG